MFRIWRYWRFLLDGRFKVWHLIALGFLWIGLGITVAAVGDWTAYGDMFCALFFANGVAHFLLIARARALQEPLEAQIEAANARAEAARERLDGDVIPKAPRPPKPEVPRPLPPAPRIGDDPFRNPPRQQVVVVRHERKESPVPRAAAETAKDPASEPKLLV